MSIQISTVSMAYKLGFVSGFIRSTNVWIEMDKYGFPIGHLKVDARKNRMMKRFFRTGFTDCRKIINQLQ